MQWNIGTFVKSTKRFGKNMISTVDTLSCLSETCDGDALNRSLMAMVSLVARVVSMPVNLNEKVILLV